MMNPLQKFAIGFLVPLRGFFLLLASSRLSRLAFLPFVLTVLIFIAGLSVGLPLLTNAVALWTIWMMSFLNVIPHSQTETILAWTIPILLWPVVALALLYALFIVTRLVAAPFYALLSERVLIEGGAIPEEPYHVWPWLKTWVRMALASLLRASLMAGVGGLLFILSFVPALGVLTGFCFLVILAFDICDYAFEALQMTFRERMRFFREHLALFVGFGFVLGLVFLVPGLNFFLFPVSVAGASDMVRRVRA